MHLTSSSVDLSLLVILLPHLICCCLALESDEDFIQRYKRDVENPGRQARLLDYYTCVSSFGTLGVCLPQPYCSYMVEGGVLDPKPTRSCRNDMVSGYGCCTLPCGTAIPAKNLPIPEAANTVPDVVGPVKIVTVQETTVATLPPTTPAPTTTPLPTTTAASTSLFAPPIMSSSEDFQSCGIANPFSVDVKRNGPRDTLLAPTGKWCWQVAVMDSSLTFKCGGTLLNKRYVLTVAHCVQKSNASQLLVRLGDTNLRSSEDNEDLVDVKVISVQIHPDYTGQSPFQHNLALLQLSNEVPTNRRRICSVCLPSLFSSTAAIESMFYRGSPNGRCLTTGYGKLTNGDEQPLMRMKEVPVPLVSNQQCTAILQNVLGSKFALPDTFLCAGSEGLADGCEYDGGGPLVCPLSSSGQSAASGTDVTYVLTGVVTWGIDCAKGGVPGVYTRIANYSSWIKASIDHF